MRIHADFVLAANVELLAIGHPYPNIQSEALIAII